MLVSSMVTVLGLAFVIGILSHSFQHQLMNELKKEAVYISRGVEAAGTDYLEQLNNIDSRVTYVDESGKVLYDNEADVESMGNHGHRKEIREAELNGEGEDERMSSTLSEKTIYYAIRLDNGNVLRVSGTQDSALALVWQLVPSLLGVLFLILVLSAVFASRLSGRVVEPLNNLDLEHPEEINVYEEVEPLISKIYRQNRQIRLQLEAARRQQKEFSIITENMQEGLLVIDRYTMVLSVNSSVGKLLKVNEVRTGESVYLLNRSEEFRGVVEQVLEGNHEDKILRLDGSDIQVIANPVTRENKTEGAVILLVDVTEKVEREHTDAKKALDDGAVAGATKIVSRDEDVYTYVQETKTKNETVGEKYLDLHTSVGLLMASGNETLLSSFSSGDDVLKINNAKSESDINEGTKSSFTKVKTDYTALLGQRVKVLYKDTDEVIGVYPVDENKVAVTVKASDLDDVTGSNNTKKIDVDGTKYTMDDDIVFYVNDTPVSGANSAARLAAFLNNAASNSDFEATVISNDDNDKIDVVRVNTKTFGKVTSATSSTIYYKGYTDGSASGAAVKVDTDDAKAYDGLKKDDYVFVHTDGFTGDVVFEQATKVTGKTDSKKDDKLRIDGTWYNIKNAKASGDANNWKINSSYDVYVYGTYAYLVEGASGSDIDTLVIKSVGDIKRMDKGVEVKALLEDGTEKVINVVKLLAANQDIDDNGTANFASNNGVALQTALTTLAGADGALVAYYEDDGDYTLQVLPASGAVKDIENNSTTTDFKATTGAYNKDKATIAGLDVANDAVVYISYNGGDDYKVVTGKQFMSYASVSNATVLYDTSDKDYVKVAFVKYTGTAASGDDLYGIVTSTYEAKNADNDTVTYFTVLTADGEKKDVESDKRYTGSIIKKGSVVTFNGSYDKMEDVTAVAGQYGAAKAYNSDTKRVSFYQGLTNTNTNAAVTLDTAKITGDSVVMYVDQTGSDWTVVASGEPGEANEYFDASNNFKGYYANVYALTNSDDEFDLLIVEVNNEIKDRTKDTIVLESGATPISALAAGTNVKSVEQKGMNITITLENGKDSGTVTAKVAKGASVSSEDKTNYKSDSAVDTDGALTLNVENVKTDAATFDITVSQKGQADLVYHVTVVQAAK